MARRRPVASIRSVFFDVGGTLVRNIDFDGVADAALRMGIDLEAERLTEAYRVTEEEYDRTWGAMNDTAFWQEVLHRASGKSVDAERAAAFIQRLRKSRPHVELFSDVIRCLDDLEQRALLLGVISNGTSEAHTRDLLEGVGILSRFRSVLTSGTETVAKPEKEIFLRAVQRLGVAPGESVYVGNLANVDARGAARAGLRGVWLNRHGVGLGSDPPEITSLTELPQWIDEQSSAPVK